MTGKLKARINAEKILCTRYPADRAALVEAIKARRGDQYVSQTVAYALDRMVEDAFPGSLTNNGDTKP